MAVKPFSFASPGIFLNEIDQSQIQKEAAPVGPVIIGRALRGPAMRPITVASYQEFVAIFGEPVAGGDSSGDVWRSGVPAGPTYGPYAAQAWLANSPTLTYVRLLGVQSDSSIGTSNNAGKAGWTLGAEPSFSTKVGSYGLFVFPTVTNAAAALATVIMTGSLAAIWYCSGSVPILSGTLFGAATVTASNCIMINSDTDGSFTVQMSGSVGVDGSLKKRFSFNQTNGNFIRKVFNTNPQNTNMDGTSGLTTGSHSLYGYWLGETFENDYYLNAVSGTSTATMTAMTSNVTSCVGIIMALKDFGTARLGQEAEDYSARTGWIISQVAYGPVPGYNPASSASKLFRFIALDGGDWIRNNLKITINNITPPQNEAQKYSTFDIEVRRVYDTDSNKKLVESYSGCTLDPLSPSYIARKIGDYSYSWDDTARRMSQAGTYPNNSGFIRVEMASDDLDSSLVPFGVLGPLKYVDSSVTPTATNGFVLATSSCFASTSSINFTGSTAPLGCQFKFAFPSARQRATSSEDSLTTFKIADWGATTTRTSSSVLYNEGINDLLKLPATGLTEFQNGVATTLLKHAWTFSLDEIKVTGSGNSTVYSYSSGSKSTGSSYTSATSTFDILLGLGVNSFTTVFQGGTDGFNILEREPLRNTAMSSPTNDNSYIYYTYRRAIDTIIDPEFVQTNMLSIPGLAQETLTEYLTQIAEQRGDCLAVIDASGGSINEASYITPYEKSNDAFPNGVRAVSVDNVVSEIKSRNFNTSYGATYFPWVQIVDSTSGKIVTVPPSIPAIGAMSYTDKVQAPWFAPAGFNRGGLSTGNAGVNVVNVVTKLNSADRDKLYKVNINPITAFPNEGIVIFGQKTLQAVPSALDRINVRRLMIYLKRGISIISNTVLFEPNVEDTWNNFKDKAEPFLADVKARFGLTDYKLILNSSTTTPDLIDQNIMYAKILLKPARAIEFIAIDFFITKSGASFDA